MEEECVLEAFNFIEKRKKQIIIVSSITNPLFIVGQYTREKEEQRLRWIQRQYLHFKFLYFNFVHICTHIQLPFPSFEVVLYNRGEREKEESSTSLSICTYGSHSCVHVPLAYQEWNLSVQYTLENSSY